MTRRDSVFLPALVIMSGRAFGYVAAFSIPVVLTRVLDPSTFGTYKQLFLIYYTLFTVAQLGMAESLYYFMPGSGRAGTRFILNALFALAMTGVAGWMLLWIMRSAIAGWLGNPAIADDLPLIGAYLFFMLIAVILEIVLTVEKRHFAASVVYGLSDTFRLVLFIVPVLVFHSLRALLWGAVALAALRCLATLVYVIRQVRSLPAAGDAQMRKQLGYALPFALAALIGVLQQDLHQYAVAWYFNAATFAIYAIGCLQIPVTDLLMTSTANVMMVSMKEKLESGRNAEVLWLWRDTTRKLVLIYGLLIGGLMVTAQPLIVLLFTKTYEASVPIFMLWTAAVSTSALLTDAMLRVYAQTRFLIRLSIIRLVIIAALIMPFLEAWGLVGAVLVVLVAAVISKMIALDKVRNIMGVSWRAFLPGRELGLILVAAFAAAGLVELVKAHLPLEGIALLMLAGGLYAACYLFCLMAFGVFTDDEKHFARHWWRKGKGVLIADVRGNS